MTAERTPVLIVGAGSAGLSLALLLIQQGIRPLVVERHDDVSWYPRARNLNFRSLEVFRSLGLSEVIHDAGTRVSRIFARECLASGEQTELIDPAALLDARTISPEPSMWYCPQSRLEPILRDSVRARGGEVRYGTDLVDFTQGDDWVGASLRVRSTGEWHTVNSQYLIGADGAHSHIRQRLEIATEGAGTLDEHYTFIYVRCDCAEFVRGLEADAFLIDNDRVRGIFLIPEKSFAMFAVSDGQSAADVTTERAREMVHAAIGRDDVPVEVIDVSPWQPEQRVATHFQRGRCLLVGDAAHTMPPKEGLGANTAIQSAQNLAWKLAAVIDGHADPELLSTYQTERRPVAMFSAKHSMTGPGTAVLDQSPMEKKASEFFPIVGYRYRSRAVAGDDTRPAPNEITLLDREELCGIPGTRVPHVWLEQRGRRISTLDLLDGRFVLLTGSRQPWAQRADRASASLGIAVAAYQIGETGDLRDPQDQWSHTMGVGPDGAILVRPDGFVGWRSDGRTTTPERLERALAEILCRAVAR